MKQCENCTEWVYDLLLIIWPAIEAPEREYLVCADCVDHLTSLRQAQVTPLPEVGSEAAQWDYQE